MKTSKPEGDRPHQPLQIFGASRVGRRPNGAGCNPAVLLDQFVLDLQLVTPKGRPIPEPVSVWFTYDSFRILHVGLNDPRMLGHNVEALPRALPSKGRSKQRERFKRLCQNISTEMRSAPSLLLLPEKWKRTSPAKVKRSATVMKLQPATPSR